MISKSLLPEFDLEMATTRKTLERVPDEKFDWKPHPKILGHGRIGHAHRKHSNLGRQCSQTGIIGFGAGG